MLSSMQDNLIHIDREIANALAKTHDDNFYLPEAVLFGIETFIGEPPLIVPIDKNADVYDMMYSENTAKEISVYTKFAVVTCGWASPMEDGELEENSLPPSQHPERKRVRLTVFYADGKINTALTFKGDKEPDLHMGNGDGDLKEAIFDLYNRSRQYTKRILND